MSNESNAAEATVPKPKPQPGTIRPKPAAARSQPAPPPRVANGDDDDDEKRGSTKGKIFIGLVLIAAIGGVTFVAKKFSSGSAAPARQEPVMVTFVPPPPPPPPPPKPTPPPQPEEKIVKETVPVEVKDEPEKPKEETPPAPAVVSSNKGKGGDPGIASSGNANPFAGLGGGGRGSEFGAYFSGMQKRIAEALRTGKSTRSAKLEGVVVKVWPDSNARIGRVEFKSGSGQPALDDAIRQSLLGLQLDGQMPEKVKPPIILRLNARAGFTAQR